MSNADVLIEMYGDQAYEQAVIETALAVRVGNLRLAALWADCAKELLARRSEGHESPGEQEGNHER